MILTILFENIFIQINYDLEFRWFNMLKFAFKLLI